MSTINRLGLRCSALGGLLAAALLLPPAATAQAQADAETPVTPDRPTMSDFGRDLSDRDAAALLTEVNDLVQQAIATSRAAENAGSVAEVKQAAAQVVQAVWGIDPQVNGAEPTEVARLGWKERWQVSGAEFDPNFVARMGSEPPRITDPRQLGIVGRARAVRGRLEVLTDTTSQASASARQAAEQTLASLNNVIGWTHITRGYKGREVQPRISLTHMWDAPPAFWNSTADTGWLFEAESQAINIIKTNYDDVEEARQHAAGMTELLQRVVDGVDANRNGIVEAAIMEGGLAAALSAAAGAGLAIR